MLPPEAAAAGDPRIDPEEQVLLADSVGLALHVVMDALTPAERVVFVLHDVFEIPFAAIAAILGRSTAATKMLASRARGRIRLGTPATAAGPRPGARVHPVQADGLPGVLVTVGGRPATVMAFTVANGTVTSIRALTDPHRLAQIVPSWVV